jgi:hypothetical protein
MEKLIINTQEVPTKKGCHGIHYNNEEIPSQIIFDGNRIKLIPYKPSVYKDEKEVPAIFLDKLFDNPTFIPESWRKDPNPFSKSMCLIFKGTTFSHDMTLFHHTLEFEDGIMSRGTILCGFDYVGYSVMFI